jgi:hypothetical protein
MMRHSSEMSEYHLAPASGMLGPALLGDDFLRPDRGRDYRPTVVQR